MDTIEATNILANLKRYISGGGVVDRKASEAINMAIRALEATTNHDTVSKQAVIENVCTMLRNCFDASDEMIESVKITVGELPPSPSRQQAEMIQDSYYSDKLVCSNCGIEARWDYEFCPYCGFKFKQTGCAV